MSKIAILVRSLGSNAKAYEVEEGTTVQELLDDHLMIDSSKKTITVNDEIVDLDYELEDADNVVVSQNNKGA